MIMHFDANTAHLRRAVILWILAFLIGPWPALSCIIHCLSLTHPNRGVAAYFLCDAPHQTTHSDSQPPPVRYDVLPLTLLLSIGGLIIVQRLTANLSTFVALATVTPDPPPPRRTLLPLA